MANRPATFSQTDVTRALRAAKAAGWPVGAVEITLDGTMRLFSENTATPPTPDGPNSWSDLDEA